MIKNFEAVRDSLEAMEDSAGSADKEMAVVEQTLAYKINALKQTWVGTVQEMADRGHLGVIIDGLTKLSEAIGFVGKNLGVLGTIGLGGGIFAASKGLGRPKMSVSI